MPWSSSSGISINSALIYTSLFHNIPVALVLPSHLTLSIESKTKENMDQKIIKEELKRLRLTEGQIPVALWVIQGASNKYVGHKLHISEKTVKFHLTNIYKKVGVKSRCALIFWAENIHKSTLPSGVLETPEEIPEPQAMPV